MPEYALGIFIEHSLPKLRAWPSQKQKELRVATTCINLSASGYLDKRLFMIAQAWELLANSWVDKPELSKEDTDLKKQLKTDYTAWRSKQADFRDQDGVLWRRINFAFEWTRLLSQLQHLAKSRNLALHKIGLDFVALKEARDDAAHRCALPEKLKNNKRSAIDLLVAAQRGLQYLLLKELGYNGDIYGVYTGYRAKMSDMLLPSSED